MPFTGLHARSGSTASVSASAQAHLQAQHEALFHAAAIDLIIPEISSFPPEPELEDGSGMSDGNDGDDGMDKWWDAVEGGPSRRTAYFDEKLFYLVAMTLNDHHLAGMPGTPAMGAKEPTSEMLRFLGRLQLTMTASFIPPLTNFESTRKTSQPLDTAPLTATSTSTLAPPTSKHLPPTPRTADSTTDGHFPPVTPNPFPAMSSGEEQYAHVEGVVVWEGAVEEHSGSWEMGSGSKKFGAGGHGSGRRVFRREGGWEVVWRGEVPIAYVRTQIQNPLLALTASVTLRDTQHSKTHRKMALSTSTDTASIRSGTETIRTEGTDYEPYASDDEGDMAQMEDIDLLGGLAGDEEAVPANRLAPSLRQDLSVASAALPSALPASAITPFTAPTVITPSTSSSTGPSRERGYLPTTLSPHLSTTLRKSYRRVLSLSPGLRVRMRTLFLPQLLPVQTDTEQADEESEGERRVVLCVEIENSVEPSLSNGFEVEGVTVDVGGKGGKATTELVCQSGNQPFPLRLGSIEQYNLLYAVSIASSSSTERNSNSNGVEEAVARSLGRGDEQRPVSITLNGRPYYKTEKGHAYPTNAFNSRWNCSLDLAPFYASDNASQPHQPRNRSSKVISAPPPNAIAGDRRYSLAGLLSAEKEREIRHPAGPGPGQRPLRPLLPSQAMNAPPGSRVTSLARPPDPAINDHGLLLSVKLLPQTKFTNASSATNSNISNGESSKSVRALEPFSIEIFVHNRTDEVRRFRLCVPTREGVGVAGHDGKSAKDVWDRRRRRRNDEPEWGVDDAVLKQLLSSHTASSPPLIPLENDVRCGPLLPGASLSARMRFVALREGVHRIEKLRLVGGGDEVDYIMNPVLDVVVGQA